MRAFDKDVSAAKRAAVQVIDAVQAEGDRPAAESGYQHGQALAQQASDGEVLA